MTSPIHTNPFTPIHRRRRNAQCLDNTLLVIHVHRRQWPLQLSAGNARALLRHRPFTPPPFTPIHRRRRNAQCLDNTLLVMHVHRGKGSSNSLPETLELSYDIAVLACGVQSSAVVSIGLYKTFVYVETVVHESTILSPPPTCIANPVAILLHHYWTVYNSPSNLPCVCYTPHIIGNNNIVYRPMVSKPNTIMTSKHLSDYNPSSLCLVWGEAKHNNVLKGALCAYVIRLSSFL